MLQRDVGCILQLAPTVNSTYVVAIRQATMYSYALVLEEIKLRINIFCLLQGHHHNYMDPICANVNHSPSCSQLHTFGGHIRWPVIPVKRGCHLI